MKLTLEITDEQLSALKNALMVDYDDWKESITLSLRPHDPHARKVAEYIYRIKLARDALDLPVDPYSMCENAPPQDFGVVTCR